MREWTFVWVSLRVSCQNLLIYILKGCECWCVTLPFMIDWTCLLEGQHEKNKTWALLMSLILVDIKQGRIVWKMQQFMVCVMNLGQYLLFAFAHNTMVYSRLLCIPKMSLPWLTLLTLWLAICWLTCGAELRVLVIPGVTVLRSVTKILKM